MKRVNRFLEGLLRGRRVNAVDAALAGVLIGWVAAAWLVSRGPALLGRACRGVMLLTAQNRLQGPFDRPETKTALV